MKTGDPLEPDCVLFLRQKTPSKSLYYQVFIEPKGAYLKEKFLLSLKEEFKIEKLWEDKKYIIWGMPFYNQVEEINFDKKFNEEMF